MVPGNDIFENSPILDFNRISGGIRPYFVLRSGRLSLIYQGSVRHPFLTKLYTMLRRHSRLLEVIRRVYFSRLHRQRNSFESGLPDNIYLAPSDPTTEYAWRVTEALLVAMNENVAGHGAKFAVATLPN